MSYFNDYEVIDHTADIGIRVSAENLNEAIEKAVLAMTSIMTGGISIKSEDKKEFEVKQRDREDALVTILEEVHFFFEQQRFTVSDCIISVENNLYKVILEGKIIPGEKLKQGVEIKAVTYHNLRVENVLGTWWVEVIFDI